MASQHKFGRSEGGGARPFAPRAEILSILSVLSLFLLTAVMLSFSWQRWSTPIHDVGRELYTAWSISQGASLYQDIWLPRGPLSSYWNGLVFWLFGSSMLTLAIANLFVLGLGVAVLHRTIQHEYGRGTALLASFLFLSVFAFGRYGNHGNYNFMMPYSHEVTHGLVLSLVLMALLVKALRAGLHDGEPISNALRRPNLLLLAAGCAMGLVMLTKQEIAISAVIATLATVLTQRAISTRRRVEASCIVALGALIPLGGCLLELGSPPFAMMWDASISDAVRENPFYQVNLGLNRPAEHLGRMGLATLVFVLELLIIAGAGRWLWKANPARLVVATALFVALHILFFAYGAVPATRYWDQAPAILPIVAGAIVLFCFATRLASFEHGTASDLLCWLAVFAAFMLLKLGLAPRITHYGFSQALPAAIIFVVVCFGVLPGQLARFRIDARFVRWSIASLVLGFCLFGMSLERKSYAKLGRTFGANADLVHIHRKDKESQSTLAFVARNVKPGETLAVLPQGAIFNYMLRVRNPTPHISFLPFEFMLTGEDRVLKDLAASPPDHVLILSRNMREYGYRQFGQRGYGDRIMAWLRENYHQPEGAKPGEPLLLRHRK